MVSTIRHPLLDRTTGDNNFLLCNTSRARAELVFGTSSVRQIRTPDFDVVRAALPNTLNTLCPKTTVPNKTPTNTQMSFFII